MNLLYWLFKCKNTMPWEAYEYVRLPGFRDLTYALASHECEGWAQK